MSEGAAPNTGLWRDALAQVCTDDHWLNELGGQTLVEHAIDKVRNGLVDPAMAEKSVGWLQARPRATPGGRP